MIDNHSLGAIPWLPNTFQLPVSYFVDFTDRSANIVFFIRHNVVSGTHKFILQFGSNFPQFLGNVVIPLILVTDNKNFWRIPCFPDTFQPARFYIHHPVASETH